MEREAVTHKHQWSLRREDFRPSLEARTPRAKWLWPVSKSESLEPVPRPRRSGPRVAEQAAGAGGAVPLSGHSPVVSAFSGLLSPDSQTGHCLLFGGPHRPSGAPSALPDAPCRLRPLEGCQRARPAGAVGLGRGGGRARV